MAKIERVPFHQAAPGQLADFFVVLSERVKKSTREGKPFFSLKFRDQLRAASVPVWSDSPLFQPCDEQWAAGQHFKIRGVYLEHERYGPQIEIQNIRLASPDDWVDGFNEDDFVLSTRFNVEELFQELTSAADRIADEGLRALVQCLLTDHEADLKRYPAARHNHHAFRGGLLEHTVSVVRTGIYLADKYAEYYPALSPPLNKDLILAGCILHDIGKLKELEAGADTTHYTIAGELIGHILMGRDMVRQAAQKVTNLNPELLLYLEHIIVAHQGLPEWGSPKEPMLPEALLVHHADDIDAKMNIIVAALGSSAADSLFTERGNAMRRRFLKSRNL